MSQPQVQAVVVVVVLLGRRSSLLSVHQAVAVLHERVLYRYFENNLLRIVFQCVMK